jgi:hypothetical protein
MYCIALARPKKQAIPTSFCDNIVNHEIKRIFIPCSLYNAIHIDSNK